MPLRMSEKSTSRKWVVSTHEVTFASVIAPKHNNALWPCTIHDCLLDCLNTVPLQSGCTCQHVCVLCWPEAWIWWENDSRLVRSIVKIMGHEITRTEFQSDWGPDGGWNNRDFNRRPTEICITGSWDDDAKYHMNYLIMTAVVPSYFVMSMS